jgi:hypothetical protein
MLQLTEEQLAKGQQQLLAGKEQQWCWPAMAIRRVTGTWGPRLPLSRQMMRRRILQCTALLTVMVVTVAAAGWMAVMLTVSKLLLFGVLLPAVLPALRLLQTRSGGPAAGGGWVAATAAAPSWWGQMTVKAAVVEVMLTWRTPPVTPREEVLGPEPQGAGQATAGSHSRQQSKAQS